MGPSMSLILVPIVCSSSTKTVDSSKLSKMSSRACTHGRMHARMHTCTHTHTHLQSPRFIKSIINNRLYVSVYAKNVVTILYLDCNVIGTIPTKECPNPNDVTEGDDGLYVVGRGEGKIGVYTCAPNGKFRHHLNIQPSSVTLSYPSGIC